MGATSPQRNIAADDMLDWAEGHMQVARMTLTIKPDRNWNSLTLANSALPLSFTDSAITPSARMPANCEARLNAPPGRLQVCWFLDQQHQQYWPKTSVRERTYSRHENQTDSDLRSGWFQKTGLAALIPKLTCSVRSGISLPSSFPCHL